MAGTDTDKNLQNSFIILKNPRLNKTKVEMYWKMERNLLAKQKNLLFLKFYKNMFSEKIKSNERGINQY